MAVSLDCTDHGHGPSWRYFTNNVYNKFSLKWVRKKTMFFEGLKDLKKTYC